MVERLFMIFVMVLLQNTLFAQTNVNTSTTVVNQEVSSVEQVKEQVINSNTSSGLDNPNQILTPEQQGFTKFNENGEIFYRKESGSLIIEYKPKK